MAHYAFIDTNNIVTEVIVGKHEQENNVNWEQYYSQFRPGKTCLRTSRNTVGGNHLLNGIPFRKNYAGIGYSYDPILDAFIPPCPFSSWTLDEETCQWEPPVLYPTDEKDYMWNEEELNWVPVI